MTDWRLAKALDEMFKEVNARWPGRSDDSDGRIGDEAHQNRDSDHNAWIKDPPGPNVVSGIDITHDPAQGFDSYAFAEWLRTQRDNRIKYVISNSRIFSSIVSPWQWRPYRGSNHHDHHVHISVIDEKGLYDNVRSWGVAGAYIPASGMPAPKPVPSMIRRGAKGVSVEVAQRELNRTGATLKVDGDFGPATEAAVKLFQKHSGIGADGIVGPQTWKALLNL